MKTFKLECVKNNRISNCFTSNVTNCGQIMWNIVFNSVAKDWTKIFKISEYSHHSHIEQWCHKREMIRWSLLPFVNKENLNKTIK